MLDHRLATSSSSDRRPWNGLNGLVAAALPALAFLALASGCEVTDGVAPDAGVDAAPIGPANVLFELPRDGAGPPSGFYALPFPNDIRVDEATGLIGLDDYIRPNELIGNYIDAVAELVDGFSVTAASFVRFDAAIDVASLPTPDGARAEGASIYLINVDQDSPELGERVPLLFRFEVYAGQTIGTNWLSVLPYPGFVLDEQTTYALVLTTRLLATDGTPVGTSEDFAAVMSLEPTGDPAVERARTLYQPLTRWLDEPGGDERADIIAATVFTTQDATSIMGDIRQVVWDEMPAPVARNIVRQFDAGGSPLPFYWYDGEYDAPCFQIGTPPFERADDGGNIVRDPATGMPAIQRVDPLRFSFTVPRGTMPASGWPVVIYAHGTGGSYHTFVYNGVAELLAAQGLAVISIDQVMHPPRIPPGASPELLFFNFQNHLSARDNVLQGAADDFQLLRVALGLDHVDNGGPDAPGAIAFDSDRIYFFGHSQGGLTGPPFLAHEPLVQGAVLSGAGGLLYLSLTLKTEPVDIAALVASFIRDYPLDEFNPVLAMVQTYMDRADPVVYGKLLASDPLPGIPPKHIYQSEGFTDLYTPVRSIEALAVSMGVDLVEPVLAPIEGLSLNGRTPLTAPVTDNGNGVTSVLVQYDEAPGSDGHFVIFDIESAQRQSSAFLGTLASTGTATLIAP